MSPLFALFILLLPKLHVPHDDAHGVATAQLANGQIETLIVTQQESKVLRTRDEGLSWEPVSGDGLELGRPDAVVWDPHPNGQHFVIGTDEGIWSYDPYSGEVQALNDGLPGNGAARWACQFHLPKSGVAGPLFMVNKLGQAWTFDRRAREWRILFDTGYADERAQIAAVPHFANRGNSATSNTIAIASQGVLFLSYDAGESWRRHPQFAEPAAGVTDPLITAICFADDYATSGNMVLATSVANPSNFTGDEGTLWHSSNFATNFQSVLQSDSSIRDVVSTPQGPSGERWFLASVLEHPHYEYLEVAVGILRSSDGGATWHDFGNAQDFVMEVDSSSTINHRRELIHDFEVSPDFANNGEIIFGRSEGLYYSRDEGLQWRRRSFRPTSQVRSLDSYINAAGDLIAFAGSYGSGTYAHNVTTGDSHLLLGGSNSYVDELMLSPRFDLDGQLLVGGSSGLSLWFDPLLGAPNPFQTLGWLSVPLELRLGYVRAFGYSPNFDARGLPGTDQVFFFTTSSESETNYVTRDGGLTLEKLDKLSNGDDAPYLRYLVVAPTFDPNVLVGPQDVYAARGPFVYQLDSGRWKPIYYARTLIMSLEIATDFDRDPLTPGLPRIFITTFKAPFVTEIIDDVGGVVANEYPDGLGDSAVVRLACPSDFGATQTLYLSTFASGVRKIDLSLPNPSWIQVGDNFPNLWATTMVLSPNFAQDHTIIVGSQAGLIIGQDVPGMTWESRRPPIVRDNYAAEFHYYQPSNPDVPDPTRTWRWDTALTQPLALTTDFDFIDLWLDYTESDGSYLECFEYAGGIAVHTFTGPDSGAIEIIAENYWTGQLVAQTTVDLSAPGWANKTVPLAFDLQPVRIKVTAKLDANERFYFDGMTFNQK
ncbi:MAG: hypothetical protein H8E15_03290 [Planctomycetes bacterium]|nr:hypothetical protein [Planctomycetota bacterium]